MKRPSLTVGRKELDQLEDYVNTVIAQPDFVSTTTQWHFYLVTTEYDALVRERITQENRPAGLFIDKPNHKVWVKSWAEIVRECEGRLAFVQEKLQIQVSAEEIQDRIAQLKASVLKTNDAATQGSDEPATEMVKSMRKLRNTLANSSTASS